MVADFNADGLHIFAGVGSPSELARFSTPRSKSSLSQMLNRRHQELPSYAHQLGIQRLGHSLVVAHDDRNVMSLPIRA